MHYVISDCCVTLHSDSKQLRVMKQRLKQQEFQEKLRQKLDIVSNGADGNQNSPTTPAGGLTGLSCNSLYNVHY